MNQLFSIQTALYLPAPEIEALIQGRIIVAVPKLSIRSGQRFALCPADLSAIPLSIEEYYRPNFLPIAKTACIQFNSEKVSIKAWAVCEICKIFDATAPLDILSQLTIWTPEALEKILNNQQYLFLNFLRVHQFSKSQEISLDFKLKEKLGKFISLPSSFSSSNSMPVLTDYLFKQRQKQLEQLKPPEHPELEQLQAELEYLKINNIAAEELQRKIQVFLGWNSQPISKQSNPDLAWIGTIAKLGDRSIELDDKKNNYQAGTDFENIVRQSLEFLGFTIDYSHKGGAGGLDLFCSKPYPLVCECKAGKLIPSRTVEELIKLGGIHLGKDKFIDSAKLVIGPGNPSSDTLKSAQEWKVSIINAMTLQKLVELHAKYSGSINLFELKQYLEPGQVDIKLEEYIQKIEKEIELRSHIIQFVKEYSENTGTERTGVDSLHGFIAGKSLKIQPKELHEILIELSSPLTGYLGRIKGEDWKRDRFCFLRDLSIT